MVIIMGTSNCHMVMGTDERVVPGMCGYVEDGIIPGFFGYEAGQSAFGDVFAWFRRLLAWPVRAGVGVIASAGVLESSALELEDKLLPALEAEAARLGKDLGDELRKNGG